MILENTNLVKQHFNPTYRYRGHRDFDNIVQIIDGRLPQPKPGGSCAARLAFPRALFYVSRGMSDDACEVFFSRNRFILQGDMAGSRRFLENLTESAARRIRKLDLKLSFDDVAKMGDQLHTIPYAERRECAWHGLIRTIRERLDLSRLWLSVDTCMIRTHLLDCQGHFFEFENYGFLNEAWYQIFAPMRQLRMPISGGLNKFHVFLAWDSMYESLAEKEIMGPTYDSAEEGKLPRHLRDYNEPHEVLQEEHHQWRHEETHVTPRGFDLLNRRREVSLAGGDVAKAWYREDLDEAAWYRDREWSWHGWSWYRHPDSRERWLEVNDSDDFEKMTVWDPEIMSRRQKYGSELSWIQVELEAIHLLQDEIEQVERELFANESRDEEIPW